MEKDTMSKENQKNYELKSDAVDKLLKAEKGEVPEFSQEELNKYRKKSRIKLSETAKVLLLKAWFAGAVCYFILWGLGMYIYSLIDMLFILGVVLGMVTDLLVNNTIRFLEKTPGGNDKWMLFPKKGMLSMGLNLLFAFIIIFCVFMTYTLVNYAIVSLTGDRDQVPIGVEPILFGMLCMGYDMLFIGIKRLLQSILRDAKAAAAANDG